MTPEWKVFVNFFLKSAFRPRFACHGQIWRKSAVAKLPISDLVLLTKEPGIGNTSKPPISPPLSRSGRKFRECCQPLSCACIPNLVWIG